MEPKQKNLGKHLHMVCGYVRILLEDGFRLMTNSKFRASLFNLMKIVKQLFYIFLKNQENSFVLHRKLRIHSGHHGMTPPLK